MAFSQPKQASRNSKTRTCRRLESADRSKRRARAGKGPRRQNQPRAAAARNKKKRGEIMKVLRRFLVALSFLSLPLHFPPPLRHAAPRRVFRQGGPQLRITQVQSSSNTRSRDTSPLGPSPERETCRLPVLPPRGRGPPSRRPRRRRRRAPAAPERWSSSG